MIAGWLKAGVFEAGKGFAPTEEGTPQGGIISPLLLNVALHGLEEAAGVRYRRSGDAARCTPDSPVLVRYADDFVACCFTEQQAEGVRERLAGWLAERGLSLNEDKTRIVHLTQGFRLPRLELPPLPQRQAADQAVQGGHQEAPATARGRDAQAARLQRDGGHRHAQPHHPGLDGLPPGHGLQRGVRLADGLHVEAHLQVGTVLAPEQAATLGHGPVLRQVLPVQAGQVGLRRPGHRRLPAQALLDENPPARHGQGRGIPRRPRPGRVLAVPAGQARPPLDSGTIDPAQPGRRNCCPLCGDRLIDTGHLPGSPEEWQDWWLGVTRQDIHRAPAGQRTPGRTAPAPASPPQP